MIRRSQKSGDERSGGYALLGELSWFWFGLTSRLQVACTLGKRAEDRAFSLLLQKVRVETHSTTYDCEVLMWLVLLCQLLELMRLNKANVAVSDNHRAEIERSRLFSTIRTTCELPDRLHGMYLDRLLQLAEWLSYNQLMYVAG
jgi:hypothetical protein